LKGTAPAEEMENRWRQIVVALRDEQDEGAAEAALDVDESSLVIVGSSQAALLFSSVSPTVTEEDVRTLASVLIDQYSSARVSTKLDDWAIRTPIDSDMPAWEQGYDLAEMVHAEMRVDLSGGWVDVASLLDSLGVTILVRRLADSGIRACSMVGPHHVPTVIRNEESSYFNNPNAQRFSLAHELCHLIFDQSRGRKLAIASGSWAPKRIEQRANAFAAMFLMPPELVQRAIADVPDPISDLAGISAVASTLHVSRRAAIDHLYNMTLMNDEIRDELLGQAG
ncbi:MAG: ImmA/IrrE family metallo-endopeptidase, partial [Actinobacteria bacterium]|nr:ImmA/IrrE family metallo-endopeptidase [Actinomycetota bacterium]